MSILFSILTIIAFAVFAARRLLTYLHIYQQEEYDIRRFLRWLADTGSFDKKLTIALIVLPLPCFLLPGPFGMAVVPAALAFFAWKEADPRKRAKKKLVLTARAKRIYILSLLLCLPMLLALCLPPPGSFVLPMLCVILVQALPLVPATAILLLQPSENAVQKKFWTEAHDKLNTLKPYVIGITGSYGKTSVKFILGHILQMSAPTLVTPGSVNTPMGIARIVREQMTPQHKYFVAEMGAYGPGSIARLCALAPPDMGIITVIGWAHYERFKSLETVADAKFELAEAVAAKNGKVVVPAALLDYPKPQRLKAAHPGLFITPDENLHAVQTNKGLNLIVKWQGQDYALEAPIFGLHQAPNIAQAFIAACALGIDPDTARTALRSLPQIAHRLEVKAQPGAATIIDDAYNSNPAGFSAALDLLHHLRRPGGRRILVTPGMVELGPVHNEKHTEIGAKAADCADIVLAVVPQRIRSFIDAYKAKASPEQQVLEVTSFAEARQWMEANLRPDDIVLLENDLPDLYESRLNL